MSTNDSNRICHDCGSDLILLEVTTIKSGNNPSLITKSTYRCSNQPCQDDSDKRANKKEELRKEQELAREIRIKNNQLAAPKPA